MSYNLYYIELMAREKQREMAEEARRLHLLARAKSGKQGLAARFYLLIGDVLIAAGTSIKRRFSCKTEGIQL